MIVATGTNSSSAALRPSPPAQTPGYGSLICLHPLISRRPHHAKGRDIRRVAFLAQLTLTTCPEGELDGRRAKVPVQHVQGGRDALDARGSPLDFSLRDGVVLPDHEQDWHDSGGKEVGEPVLPLLLGHNWGEIRAELGEWLFAGHQKSAAPVLQRWHWLPSAGAPGRRDKRCTQREPIQWVCMRHCRKTRSPLLRESSSRSPWSEAAPPEVSQRGERRAQARPSSESHPRQPKPWAQRLEPL